MNGQEYLDLLKTRYSVRSFSDVQLTDAELDVLLQAAQLSPTAKNSRHSAFAWCKAPKALRRSTRRRAAATARPR